MRMEDKHNILGSSLCLLAYLFNIKLQIDIDGHGAVFPPRLTHNSAHWERGDVMSCTYRKSYTIQQYSTSVHQQHASVYTAAHQSTRKVLSYAFSGVFLWWEVISVTWLKRSAGRFL